MNSKLKRHLISALITFISTFLAYLSMAVAQLPIEEVVSGKIFNGGIMAGLVFTSARAGFKAAVEHFTLK